MAEQTPLEGEEIVESASSDGTDAGSSSDEEQFLEKQRSVLDAEESMAVEGDLMQNKRGKMLHRRNPDEANHLQPVTLCGLQGMGFLQVPCGSTFDWPKRSKCFKNEAEKDKNLVEASNLGLDDEWVQGLKGLGVKSLGGSAFACGQPGSPVAEPDVRALLDQAVRGKDITVGRLENPPDGIGSAGGLGGGSLCVNRMVESDTLKYLSPAKCITRMQEITSAKPPKELKLDSSGSGILVKDAQSEQTCSGFATAAEVEYPLELCKQWAAIIARVVERTFQSSLAPLPSHPDKKARAHSMKQTRKSLAFMPEWSHVQTANFADSMLLHFQWAPSCNSFTKLTVSPYLSLRAFCALLLLPTKSKMGGQVLMVECNSFFSKERDGSESGRIVPLLRDAEAALHAELEEILSDMGYPDVQSVRDMKDGFDLVGTAEEGGILPAEFQPATLTVKGLSMHAGRSNRAVFHSTKSSGDDEVDAELWKKMLAEVDKGWLEELPGLPDDDGRVSRRFAVVQAEGKGRH
eukprot:s326_g9.t1